MALQNTVWSEIFCPKKQEGSVWKKRKMFSPKKEEDPVWKKRKMFSPNKEEGPVGKKRKMRSFDILHIFLRQILFGSSNQR